MLVAFYNVWDYEHLRKSVDNIKPVVDKVIIVWSKYSNYGNEGNFNPDEFKDCICIKFESRSGYAYQRETAKRNYGLQKAKKLGAKYFLMMDCDEFYHQADILKWYDYLKSKPELNGLVCKLKVYFKEPTLVCDDVTYVTFIHRLEPNMVFHHNQNYPYAHHEGHNRIDPTRRLNIDSGVELIDCYMHHYSWVRNDINTKALNSTARNTILKSNVFKDLELAKPGYFCEFYGQELKEVPNYFGV